MELQLVIVTENCSEYLALIRIVMGSIGKGTGSAAGYYVLEKSNIQDAAILNRSDRTIVYRVSQSRCPQKLSFLFFDLSGVVKLSCYVKRRQLD